MSSRKARGADDRFGVLAYKGVGPSRLVARSKLSMTKAKPTYRGRFIRNN